MSEKWTREEEIVVFNLYCKIPFQRSSKTHPDVVRIADLIGRSPSAVNMKIGNFGSFDDNLKVQGIVGLTNASKLDKEIWDEFNGNWDGLAYESEKLIAEFAEKKNNNTVTNIPPGKEKEVTVKQRVNQAFFREAVLASYKSTCCITGLYTRQLLIASHIKPWKDSSESEKTNPQNGLCLNSLHDKAFDCGYMTITPTFDVVISNEIKDIYEGEVVKQFFKKYHGRKLILPEKFIPKAEFLEYHNNEVFEKWKN